MAHHRQGSSRSYACGVAPHRRRNEPSQSGIVGKRFVGCFFGAENISCARLDAARLHVSSSRYPATALGRDFLQVSHDEKNTRLHVFSVALDVRGLRLRERRLDSHHERDAESVRRDTLASQLCPTSRRCQRHECCAADSDNDANRSAQRTSHCGSERRGRQRGGPSHSDAADRTGRLSDTSAAS